MSWLTIRSDHNDQYARPDGVWIGTALLQHTIGIDGQQDPLTIRPDAALDTVLHSIG